MRLARFFAVLSLAFAVQGFAADNDAKQRLKAVHELGKGGSEQIPKIEAYLTDPDLDVRLEAVKAIIQIGTQFSLDPLIRATSDNDPEVQIRAVDGLVNFYLPGYVKTGFSASLQRAGSSIKGHFTDTNDQVIDPYIQVRPEVIASLGKLARGGISMESRANSARALGILRGLSAVPDLLQAVRNTKDSQVIYESLIALQKIRDESAGPQIHFLLRDLDEKVQTTAIETEGLLRDQGAIPDIRDVLDHTRSNKVRRYALTAMAAMPTPELHPIFVSYLENKDENLREAAAEGLGRLRNDSDQAKVKSLFDAETKTGPRLSFAFALVEFSNRDMSDFAPLRYLVNQLNSAGYRDVARAYLIELARDAATRQALYSALQAPVVTKAEKTGLAQIFARSGGADSVPYLETLSKDSDSEVAQEGLRALRNLNARL